MTSPVLARGEVHIWCITLDIPPETTAGLYATLSGDERNRSAQFRFESDRRRFVVARGVLREMLGRYLGIDPGQVGFAHNGFGKPALSPEFGNRLKFNLSHSAGCALIALAADADLGVDLEYIRPLVDQADIARQFFSAADVDRLNRLPSHVQPRAFFGCWTKKEAYVKARGEALDFDRAPHETAADPRWSFYTLQPAPGYIGALVVEGSGWQLREWQWEATT